MNHTTRAPKRLRNPHTMSTELTEATPLLQMPLKGIGKISYSHEALINWLLVNPDRPLSDAAAYFGYTQAWLSTIIHSDVFQAKLLLRQNAVFASVAADLPAKLGTAAHIALDRMTEKLTTTDDPRYLLDATDKLLHRMGYAPAAARNPIAAPVIQTNTQINNFTVSSADLGAARAMAQAAGAQTAHVPALIEHAKGGGDSNPIVSE